MKGIQWLELTPLTVVVAVAAIGATIADAPAGRLDPSHAWCVPSTARPLGCGEAGVDLTAVVSSGALHAVALAVVVALFSLAVGTPLGISAALARGRFERMVDRGCDLVQAFPTFILAL